jgi:YD repeat-containing protein
VDPLLSGRIAGFERGASLVLAVQEEHPCAMRFSATGPRKVLTFDGSYLVRVGEDTATFERDPRGRIANARYNFADGTGFTTEFTYNRQGALAMATSHVGDATITQRFRWLDGQVAAVVEVDGTQSPRVMTEMVFGYDRRGWPNRMRVRQSREASFDLHFENGLLTRETDRAGSREMTYQYDAQRRLQRAGDAEFFYGAACSGS